MSFRPDTLDLAEQKKPDDRIAFGGCSNGQDAISGSWDREIGGIFFAADMTTKKVLRVIDYGAIPPSATTGIYDAMGGEALPGNQAHRRNAAHRPQLYDRQGPSSAGSTGVSVFASIRARDRC